jgi:3',5'-cyclic AMP phosphodiesterase CpdA
MDSESLTPDVTFIHLSDIHFRQGRAGDAHDEDGLLRHELQRDLRRIATRFRRLDGLIVSGDVAYSGKAAEYDYATSWLESIRELLGCPRDAVTATHTPRIAVLRGLFCQLP